MTDLTPILTGARFRIRDCWPFGLRYLTSHLTPWAGRHRGMKCGITDNGVPVGVYQDANGRWRWHARMNAGHATQQGRFAPSLDVLGSEPCAGEAEARTAADAALLAWFADRIADGSVIYTRGRLRRWRRRCRCSSRENPMSDNHPRHPYGRPALCKVLRAETGASLADCHKALTECRDDMDRAIEWLRSRMACRG